MILGDHSICCGRLCTSDGRVSCCWSKPLCVFPLKGKLLNVREASHKKIMENVEIKHIKQILILQHGKQYDSVKSLRYSHLMIMTDQVHVVY